MRLQQLKALRNGASGAPLTLHLADAKDAEAFMGPTTDLARRMMQKLWPGPVGLMFEVPADRRAQVAATLGIAPGDLYDSAGTITLRCPDHWVARDVIASAGKTRGDLDRRLRRFGLVDARSPAAQLAKELSEQVAMVIDAGPTRYTQPSTIVKLVGGPLRNGSKRGV